MHGVPHTCAGTQRRDWHGRRDVRYGAGECEGLAQGRRKRSESAAPRSVAERASVRSAVLGPHDKPELSPGLLHDEEAWFRLPVVAAAAAGHGQPAA
ncbi:MAG TPA: hypothetical protein PLP66_12665 [Phycisphaerae bacterium]|nr:hypothetical protein [Phycisphaerae bacterium]